MDGLGIHQDSVAYQCIRELLLSTGTRQTKVARELWCGPYGTYQAYRQYLRKTVQLHGFPAQRAPGLLPTDSRAHSMDRTRKPVYAFSGMEHVFDCSKHPISVMAFASQSTELLAFGNSAGGVWVMQLPSEGGELGVTQMEPVHEKTLSGLDWSFDNTLLLTCSSQEVACLWAPPSPALVRSFAVQGAANCCRFHPTNPNLVLIGTSKAAIEVFNASTGARVQRQPLPGGTEVTALTVTPTNVFAGDSTGRVHMLSSLMKEGVLQRLTPQCRLHCSLTPRSPVTSLSLQPVCHSADNCPALLVSCLDASVVVVKVIEQGKVYRLELHTQHSAPRMARAITPQWCPLSPLHNSDYIAMGAEDTSVYIYDIAPYVTSPVPVAALQGHCAPTTTVSWCYDERFLASGDCNGTVIVWKRDETTMHTRGGSSSRAPSSTTASQPTTPTASAHGTPQPTPRSSFTGGLSQGSPTTMSRASSSTSLPHYRL